MLGLSASSQSLSSTTASRKMAVIETVARKELRVGRLNEADPLAYFKVAVAIIKRH
jgi:hypothetical protein